MKLVFSYYFYDEEFSGRHVFPFEYSSIEDFQYMVLEKIKEHKDAMIKLHGEKDGSGWYKNGYVKIFDEELNVFHLEESIEYGVLTLEDWFNSNKIN